MSFVKLSASALALAAVSATAVAAQDRTQIRIVGSSTVFPFATAVAEEFGNTTDFATPIIESTGSGGGLKLFCAGVGVEHPDVTNASRRVKMSEVETCLENGVEFTEVLAGYDGLVMANAASGPDLQLTKAQVWQALAAEGPRPTTWDEVDPALPAVEIEVLGPPPTSGTRDSFEELVMEKGCEQAGGEDCEGAGMEIREDGPYVEAGENDNLIVSKLEANDRAVGVFGFSFLDQNRDSLKGVEINGVMPTFDAIASGEYEVSRSMFFYIKHDHVGVIPGVKEYAREFVAAQGPDGYLVDLGMIPVSEDGQEANLEAIETLPGLTPETY
ncbi:phosphate ABC transporter substrate-binding protein [Rhodosalinus sediminis]|uniref:Phosphate ABC transporter substrate-binding protein n=1 Tax=Rhodosalinus sediminis TaxID=1940533 RepID=A0A3D9BPW1_9RHOB|nr:substrate-binding domain-containing protein [Rhodosalinus sediminis]REC55507.1 phosphate ABC transporter substrate-binding protein [Rhodosalinus sediminis]